MVGLGSGFVEAFGEHRNRLSASVTQQKRLLVHLFRSSEISGSVFFLEVGPHLDLELEVGYRVVVESRWSSGLSDLTSR